MEHVIYYYPYSRLDPAYAWILAVTALYFDKLLMLDPVGAGYKPTPLLLSRTPKEDIDALVRRGKFEAIKPADVLAKCNNNGELSKAIRADIEDPGFKAICDMRGGGNWEIWTAKIPQDIQDDYLKDFARDSVNLAAPGLPPELEEKDRLWEENPIFDGGPVYRVVKVPVHVGAAIILNHALYGGMLKGKGTPVTSDPLHARLFAHKLAKLRSNERFVKEVLDNNERRILLKSDAGAFLGLQKLDLGVFSGNAKIEDILNLREERASEFGAAREKFDRIVLGAKEQLWSQEFEMEVQGQLIRDFNVELANAAEASRVPWFNIGVTAGALGGVAITLIVAANPLFSLPSLGVLLSQASTLKDMKEHWDRVRGRGIPEGLHYFVALQNL